MISWIYLAGAIAMITAAHLVRVARWEMFIEVYEKPQKRRLNQALSMGFLINYIVPFKLGDIARAWYAGSGMKTGKALGFATVIVERFLDIVCVGIIFLAVSFGNAHMADDLKKTANIYIFASAALLFVGGMIFCLKRYVKKLISKAARIFNESIENFLLKFSFALIACFKNIILKMSCLKLMIVTIAMWGLYIMSYALLAASLSHGVYIGRASWIDVFIMLFSQNSIMYSTGNIISIWFSGSALQYSVAMLAYMILPSILLLLIGMYFRDAQTSGDEDRRYVNLLPHMDRAERLVFLETYFSDENRDYLQNYLKINEDISIIKNFSAGSNAVTLLCMDGDTTFFRKYAFGEDGEKLYDQECWIRDYSDKLPLPAILKQEKTEFYCFYDMPYHSHASGLFEYVHSVPRTQAWDMIENVLRSLEGSIYRINARSADIATIDRYIEEKVLKNIHKIKHAKWISGIYQYDKLVINGIAYENLNYYEKYLKKEVLEEIFIEDFYAVIHGDLTLENVICTRMDDGRDGFYIIDPNTGNIHESPFLDYGKMLQSIHGGYEFLMSTEDVRVSGNRIDFRFTASSAYADLHEKLKDYLMNHLGFSAARSIYFHEIIHWLRLMPYKIEKDGKRCLLFYAGMLIVMHDVIGMYGDLLEVS